MALVMLNHDAQGHWRYENIQAARARFPSSRELRTPSVAVPCLRLLSLCFSSDPAIEATQESPSSLDDVAVRWLRSVAKSSQIQSDELFSHAVVALGYEQRPLSFPIDRHHSAASGEPATDRQLHVWLHAAQPEGI